MQNRIYEINDDYVLDVLEQAASKSINKIFDNIDEDLHHEFSKLLAILNEIEKINIKNETENQLLMKVQ